MAVMMVISSHCHDYKSFPIPVDCNIDCDSTPAWLISNMTGNNNGEEVAYSTEAPELTLIS